MRHRTTWPTIDQVLRRPRLSGRRPIGPVAACTKEIKAMTTLAYPTLSRRAAVRLGGGAAAALAARAAAPVAAKDQPAAGTPVAAPPATSPFVLVHGAWAGAWIWRKIMPLLRAAGHDVYASTATGMGDRVHLAD